MDVCLQTGTVVGCTSFAACVGVYNAMATGDSSLGLPILQLPLTYATEGSNPRVADPRIE